MSRINILKRDIYQMKFLILFFCTVLISCNTSASNDEVSSTSSAPAWFVTISGKVGFPQKGGQIFIQEMKDNSTPGWRDTINLKSNYTYSKKIKLSEPGYYKINFFNKQVVSFILNKSNLEINADGNNQQGFFEIKNSPDLNLIRQVQEQLAAIESSPAMQQLNADYRTAMQNNDQKKIADLQEKAQEIVRKEHTKIAATLEQNSPSLAVINLLQSQVIDKDKYFSTYVAVADKLKATWSEFSHSKAFIASVEKMKLLAVGRPAPEIALPDPNGKVIKLSSMKGKYVLVDFWAKWCGPCRQENPNVVRVFNKYKDKGFTVFGVSLDRTREDWLLAIEQDGLTWTHVSDLKYWDSEAAKTYNITGIPFSVLLDPDGVIVAKNLRGAALEKKVAELLDKK